MSKPTLAQIQQLYKSTLTAAGRFASYNYRTHFLRRADEVFRPVIASMENQGKTDLKSSPSTAEKTAPDSRSVSQQVDLSQFYEEHTKELEVLQRAAEVNRAFKGDKLVVEHPRLITSGGGAGMEAAAGGGGQPV